MDQAATCSCSGSKTWDLIVGVLIAGLANTNSVVWLAQAHVLPTRSIWSIFTIIEGTAEEVSIHAILIDAAFLGETDIFEDGWWATADREARVAMPCGAVKVVGAAHCGVVGARATVTYSAFSQADAVVWKLESNCPEEATEGTRLMKKMLEHLQIEFKWEKIADILEAAAEEARSKKEECYREARACQDELREIRRQCD